VAASSHPETLDDVLESIGAAGQRMTEIDAAEAGAGNISVCLARPVDLSAVFDATREILLPYPSPALAGHTVLITGSGCRLRSLTTHPERNLGAVVVHEGGMAGTLHYAARGGFGRPTVEFNSHLAVHEDHVRRRSLTFHAIVHAQPLHITLLSNVPDYQSTGALSDRLLRWQAETIVHLPEGIAYLPFMVPGSDELTIANLASLRTHQLVLWAKHGVMARSAVSVLAACDRIEYAETAARYEYLNLTIGGRATGLTNAELGRVVRTFGIHTTLLPRHEETSER
jgi:rhamnulose-1-phosphate aldolase